LYSLSLRIYPRAFADEMLYVFSQAAQDASIDDLFAFTRLSGLGCCLVQLENIQR